MTVGSFICLSSSPTSLLFPIIISSQQQANVRTGYVCQKKKFESIIYGHIHQTTNEYYNGIHYSNSGDWVESLTALVEDEQGSWSVVTYTEGLSVKSKPDSTLQKPFETHRSTTICFEINIHNNLLKLKQL